MVCVIMASEKDVSGLLVSLNVLFVFPHLKPMAAIRVKRTRSRAELAAVHIRLPTFYKHSRKRQIREQSLTQIIRVCEAPITTLKDKTLEKNNRDLKKYTISAANVVEVDLGTSSV